MKLKNDFIMGPDEIRATSDKMEQNCGAGNTA